MAVFIFLISNLIVFYDTIFLLHKPPAAWAFPTQPGPAFFHHFGCFAAYISAVFALSTRIFEQVGLPASVPLLAFHCSCRLRQASSSGLHGVAHDGLMAL